MAEKILYYLGAGASVKALPLAKTVWDPNDNTEYLIRGLAFDLSHFDWKAIKVHFSDQDNLIMNTLDRRFKDLAEKADAFGDVDTYAKYLHLMDRGGSELTELKKTLSLYFAIKQKFTNALDSRYLPWLVCVMDQKMIPDNVKILSWNYDYQLELAAAQIGGTAEDVAHSGAGFSHTPAMLTNYPSLDPTFDRFGELSLIHLNGIAGYLAGDLEGNFQRTASTFQDSYSNLENLNALYLEKNELKPQLHFAWEKSHYHKKLMDYVRQMIDRTTILVVVGYSFPFFNREVDKQIFQKLDKLKKIYYQDPVLDGQHLKSQFGLRDNFRIVHIKNTDNFHVPFEY